MAPTSIKVSIRYGSHMKPLLQALLKTRGVVLELGVGIFSTHTLHWLCALQKRRLTTMENNRHWYNWGMQYKTDTHQVIRIKDWDDAPIDRQWDVVLVDHSPDARRAFEIARLAKRARYIIAHDADWRYSQQYGYDHAFLLFKHQLLYNDIEPATMILSNFENLEMFWSEQKCQS